MRGKIADICSLLVLCLALATLPCLRGSCLCLAQEQGTSAESVLKSAQDLILSGNYDKAHSHVDVLIAAQSQAGSPSIMKRALILKGLAYYYQDKFRDAGQTLTKGFSWGEVEKQDGPSLLLGSLAFYSDFIEKFPVDIRKDSLKNAEILLLAYQGIVENASSLFTVYCSGEMQDVIPRHRQYVASLERIAMCPKSEMEILAAVEIIRVLGVKAVDRDRRGLLERLSAIIDMVPEEKALFTHRTLDRIAPIFNDDCLMSVELGLKRSTLLASCSMFSEALDVLDGTLRILEKDSPQTSREQHNVCAFRCCRERARICLRLHRHEDALRAYAAGSAVEVSGSSMEDEQLRFYMDYAGLLEMTRDWNSAVRQYRIAGKILERKGASANKADAANVALRIAFLEGREEYYRLCNEADDKNAGARLKKLTEIEQFAARLKDFEFLAALSREYIQEANLAKALDAARAALECASTVQEQAAAYSLIGWIRYSQNASEASSLFAAIEDLRKAVALNGEDYYSYYYLFRIYEDLVKKEKGNQAYVKSALEYADRFLAMESRVPGAYKEVQDLFKHVKKKRSSIERLNRQ